MIASSPYLPEKPWLSDWQKKHLAQFQQRGCPSMQEERWKYTDLTELAAREFNWPAKSSDFSNKKENIGHTLIFVNGYFSAELSDSLLLPNGILLCPLSQALLLHEDLIKKYLLDVDVKQHPFLTLNSALMGDGLFVHVSANVSIEYPIHCVFVNSSENNFQISPRNIIVAETNSQISFIEEHRGVGANDYFVNTSTYLTAHPQAKINYYKIQDESATASHLSHTLVTQQQESQVKIHAFDLGGKLVRNDIQVKLLGTDAATQLLGLYNLCNDYQHVDNHLEIEHAASRSQSRIVYKGLLTKKTRAVFNGRVYVQPNIQRIEASQINRNLLLSAEAEVNTKPELEIYADDVKCKHGATTGFLDTEALFYLSSRGIEKEEAIRLLTAAFADEIIHEIESVQMRDYIQRALNERDV